MADHARQAPVSRTLWRSWPVALALALLLSGLLILLFAVPPVYQVYLDGRLVARSRNLDQLVAAVKAEVQNELGASLTLTAGDNTWTYTRNALGLIPAGDAEAALREAAALAPWWQRNLLGRPALRLEGLLQWNETILAGAMEPVRAKLYLEPVPARFAVVDRQPKITPEMAGITLEVPAVLAALRGLGSESRVELPLAAVTPEVTQASLEAMRIRKLVASWTTAYDPTIPRADNVERAAKAFNGVVIKPGEMLSYNAVVGPVDSANGWKEAFVIVNGELVPGVGGGVCQVATTLYGAALRANLEILERHQHQLAVSYIEPSQDAAIAQGWEDLKIRNTSEGYIYIETESGGGRVTFRLYGDVPDDQEVKIESRVLGSKPFPVKQVADPSLAPGQQVVKSGGIAGLSSEAYRLVYKSGQLVKKELLSRDSYLPTTQVVLVGPAAVPVAGGGN